MKPKFWMVLGGGMPVYRHQEKESARKEAERLAMENPGHEFTVLEALATVKSERITWTVNGPDDSNTIPF